MIINECLRVVFTAYWQDASPSSEVFFLQNRSHVDLKCIAMLEQIVTTLLSTWSTTALVGVVYIGQNEIELSEDDINQIGWRMIP